MKITRRDTIQFIVIFTLFLVLISGFFIHSFYIRDFNKKVFEYNTKEESKIFNVSVKPSVAWKKDINGDNQPDFFGITYSVDVKNTGKKQISYWKMKININENCYLNQAWCGLLEVHQKALTDNNVEILDLHHEVDKDKVSCEYYMLDENFTVPLYEGDYIIYSPDKISKEYPIDYGEEANNTIGIGFIFYKTTIEPMDISNIDVTYSFHKGYNDSVGFYFLVTFSVIWLFLLVIFTSFYIKMKKVNERFEQDSKIIEQSIAVFIEFFEAKDSYTKGHSKRVAYYSELLAKAIGMPKTESRKVYYIALMHDCGKCYVPDTILKKPGKLTEEEYNQIKLHTVKGAEMIKDFTAIENIRDGVLYHHERYDGKGYPEGLAGENIPLIGRIICIADSFDAMNSDRCYKNKMNKQEILHELKINKGKQFDPYLVDVFIKLIEIGKIHTVLF